MRDQLADLTVPATVKALGILVILFGLPLLAGGFYLITLGGSIYFLLMGGLLVYAGIYIFRRKIHGAHIFAIGWLITIIWALFEVGFYFWPLVSRLFALSVLALLISLAVPTLRRLAMFHPAPHPHLITAGLALALIATTVAAFYPKDVITPKFSITANQEVSLAETDWSHWSNTSGGTRFSPLDDITPFNIEQLSLAWTAHTGDIPISNGSGAEDQNTPLQIGENLYICTPYSKVIALHVDSGKELWRYDAKASAPNWQRCRGLSYVETPTSNDCKRRLFLPTTDARLIAINAENGTRCADFGNQGSIDLSLHMGEIKDGYYQQTSAPLIANQVVIVGGRVADNFSTDEPPGVVRAYNIINGKLIWAWDSGNPAVTRLPVGQATYSRGAPNVWSAMSFDEELDLVYLPTGNATPDFYAAQRTEQEDKYSSSLVALEAKTGKVRWHFQMTHHDLWDFDIPAQPTFVDMPNDHGIIVPALIQVTKQGEIFALDRRTGLPIAPVEERPVPQGNTPGERYATTQPFSVGMPNIGNTPLVEADMWGATPLDQLWCRIAFKKMRHDGIYTPPGLDPGLQFPGSLGGMNWGGVSYDPIRQLIFVNDMRLGLANYLIPRDQVPSNSSGIEMGIVPQEGTPYGAMRQRFLSPLGVPCQKPPFGTLTAIDLNRREILWQVPVGTVQDTGPLGIKMRLPIPIGMPTLGPSLATASGLVFFAGTQDFYLRAYDSNTGKEIWKSRLPVGSQSGPMSYRSPSTGKQYILINAGGARQSPDRGDYILAYSLNSKRLEK